MMRRVRRGPTRSDVNLSIPVTATPNGAVAANAFAGWESQAGTVGSVSQYGSTDKYFGASTNTTFLARSINSSRDQEFQGFMGQGRVFLRLTDDGACYMLEVDTQFRAVTIMFTRGMLGLSASSLGFSGGQATGQSVFFDTASAQTVIPGWNNTATSGAFFTFGVSGFDLYCAYNGVEFFRRKVFHQLRSGRLALGQRFTGPASGFRNVTAVLRSSVPLFSDISTNTFDVRDFGLKSLTAVGSIANGSNTLQLANDPGFSIGDQIVIATGGELGGGVPGEQGVGGSWPQLTYATLAARNADTTQPLNKVAGVLETGLTYLWNGSTWITYSTSGYNLASQYLSKILPKALLATITNISGTTLTLDRTALASTINANVYYNCRPYFNRNLGPPEAGFLSGLTTINNATIYFPPGTWAFGHFNESDAALNQQSLNIETMTGLTLTGAGRNLTTLISPTGTASLMINCATCPNIIVQDMELRGNFRSDKGYQLRYQSLGHFGTGIDTVRMTSCPNGLMRRLRTYNQQQSATAFSFTSFGTIFDVLIIHETGHLAYQQWAANVSDSWDCTIDTVNIDTPHLMAGIETFRSERSRIRNITGRNALFSTNSSNGYILEDLDVYYETGSAETHLFGYPQPLTPLIDLNTNVDNSSGSSVGGGGIVRNFRIDIRGKIWPTTSPFNLVQVIATSGNANNILIGGKYPAKPVTQPAGLIIFPAGLSIARAVYNDAATRVIVVDGVRVINGSNTSSMGNFQGIPTPNLTIRNCVIDNQTAGGTQTNNITNAAYEALP